jgi:hypothetical protein
MQASHRFLIALSVAAICVLTTSGLRAEAPYVDSKAIKERFKNITEADMKMLREKKILLVSRSFGLNLCNGLRVLAKEDAKYDLLGSYERYDIPRKGFDSISADAFKDRNFVHVLGTYWPHTKRMEETDDLLRKPPHEFGKTVDVVIVFFHIATPDNFDAITGKMDAMQKDFPKVKFIYVASGFMAKEKEKENAASFAYAEKVRERYKGKAPLYDMGAILSDDHNAGHHFAPDYSKDPAGVHPNTDLGQTMMAKGFLLVLTEAFKNDGKAAAPAVPASRAEVAGAKVETLAPTHPDYVAVRAILDKNALTKKTVESITVVENGRVVKLYLQEGGLAELTDEIGVLTDLRLLHLYGDRALGLPLLKKISPAIAKCTKLEELLLNNNDLTTLPAEIVGLKKLRSFTVDDNPIKGLSPALSQWVKAHEAKPPVAK